MLHQHNVEVIDDGLTRKENDRLQTFPERNGDSAKADRVHAGTRYGHKIRNNNGQYASQNGAFDSHAQFDQNKGSAQPHQPFQHEIDC